MDQPNSTSAGAPCRQQVRRLVADVIGSSEHVDTNDLSRRLLRDDILSALESVGALRMTDE